MTGETGAGKSIIIGALQLLLGERADKSLIRSGADLCTVEAVFNGESLRKLNPQLDEAGLEPSQDELIIKRTMAASGTNRQFINGSPTTLSVLKNLGDELVDLHGPHDHQSLLSPEKQLALLVFCAHGKKHWRNTANTSRNAIAPQKHATLNTAEHRTRAGTRLLRHQGQ